MQAPERDSGNTSFGDFIENKDKIKEVPSALAKRERFRQIEFKALRKMRHPTRIRKLEGLIGLPVT